MPLSVYILYHFSTHYQLLCSGMYWTSSCSSYICNPK